MDITRAKEILKILADGIDPLTGELLPPDHLCNQPEVIRAFHEILTALPSAKSNPSLPNAGKPWSESETDKLVEEYDSGMSISAIAKEHGRSRGAIEGKLAHLGKIENPYYASHSR